MPDHPTPRRVRVRLGETAEETLARRLYEALPWWRRLVTRAPKGGR